MHAAEGKAQGQIARPTALRALKVVHTSIWLTVEACMVYVLVCGIAGRSDRRAAAASAVVAGESLVFLANGARCPLTELGVRFGGERASVTDIYLPGWLAHNLPVLHVPLVIAAVVLHVRTLRRQRGDGGRRSCRWGAAGSAAGETQTRRWK